MLTPVSEQAGPPEAQNDGDPIELPMAA